MRDGWEIKKLGEVCEIQTGKLDANAKVENGIYPFYTCDAMPYRIDTFAFDDEAILISGNGSLVGHVNYYKGKFNAYQRTYVLTAFNSFNIPFLLLYLKGYLRQYIYAHKKGGCIPYITLPILKNFEIPCPPLSLQEKIVSELDLLSGVIEKKRQQLKELDNLAQSIFYDMFGDPITNEKGWEVKKFDKCYQLASGQGLSSKSIVEGVYPVYGGNGIVGYHKEYNLDGDNIIIGRVGALCGNVRNVIGKAFITDNAFILSKKDVNINVFVLYLLRIHNLRNYAREAMQPVISNTGLKNIEIILPPLTLQQEFATKIEAIEKQKELIKRSIAETETLFNSRMDYYFN